MHRSHKPSVSQALRPVSRMAVRWALAAACVAGLGVVGCDQVKQSSVSEADTRVETNLQESEANRTRGTDKGAKDASTFMGAAVNEAGASPAAKAHAKAQAGRLEFDDAIQELPEVEARELHLNQLEWKLRQLAGVVESARLTKAKYDQLDPAQPAEKGVPTKDAPNFAITARANRIKAAQDKLDIDAKTIQADITKRKAEIEALTAEKTKAETDAEALATKSAAVKGKESLELFKQSSDLRQKAGELATKIEVATLSLAPAEGEMAIIEQQKLAWDHEDSKPELLGATQRLVALRTQADAGWTDLKKGIADALTAAKNAGEDIAKETDKLKAAAAAVKAARDDVAAKLTAAAKHFGEAGDEAKKLREALSSRLGDAKASKTPQADAWKDTLRVYDESNLRLQQGSAQLQLAQLHLGYMNELTRRKAMADSVTAALKGLDIAAPADLSPDSKDLDAAKSDAVKYFTAAEAALDIAARLATDDDATRNAAHLLAIESRVAHLTLVDDAAAKETKAGLEINQAYVTTKNVQLPVGLGGTPPAPATSEKPPVTTPAETPPAPAPPEKTPEGAPGEKPPAPAPTEKAPEAAPAEKPPAPAPTEKAPDAVPAK